MILVIDNYDSFTWNLVHRLGELLPGVELGHDLVVVRNDKLTVGDARALNGGRGPSRVLISPGPCTPSEAGVSGAFVQAFAGEVPVLGVCLGHQCIAAEHGMRVDRHAVLMHGKTSEVMHDGRGVFEGLSEPFVATRYHSLVVPADSVPAGGDWAVSAWVDEALPGGGTQRVVMGLRRVWGDATRAPLEGVQFHPESFLTDEGPRLLANFLAMPSAVPGPTVADAAAAVARHAV